MGTAVESPNGLVTSCQKPVSILRFWTAAALAVRVKVRKEMAVAEAKCMVIWIVFLDREEYGIRDRR